MLLAAALFSGLQVLPSLAAAGMTGPVAFQCRGAAGVEDAASLCAEFRAVLQDMYPDRTFSEKPTGLPGIEVTLTHADQRSLGAAIVFVDLESRRTEGKTLRTAFFDRNSDRELRRRFFVTFVQQNPLPF